jgi:hypothetical protein
LTSLFVFTFLFSNLFFKFAVVAAKYDSEGWWSKDHHGNTYRCTTTATEPEKICRRGATQVFQSERIAALKMMNELLGTCILIQLARSVSIIYWNLVSHSLGASISTKVKRSD